MKFFLFILLFLSITINSYADTYNTLKLEKAKQELALAEKELERIKEEMKANWKNVNKIVEEVNVELPAKIAKGHFTLERFTLKEDMTLYAEITTSTPYGDIFLDSTPGVVHIWLREDFCGFDMSKISIDAGQFEYVIRWKDKKITKKITKNECEGNIAVEDHSKERENYEKECDAGDAESCSELAMMYEDGDGVEEDFSKAIAYYDKACNARDAEICMDLADMYEYGDDVEKDISKAIAYYDKACNAGDSDACEYYAEKN